MKRRMKLFTVFCTIAFITAPLRGQQPDPVAESLKLTRSSGSLPFWEKPPPKAVQELSGAVRSVDEGVFLVGNGEDGYGTGFVISRRHRLLATNAHVADIKDNTRSKLLAIRNDSGEVYEVERIWYHPGVMRKLEDSPAVRSQDPADGSVVPRCPDLAVLLLADGPDMPMEFQLATKDEAYDAFARPVGMLGFPGHDTSWPGIGEKAVATFRQGVISRLTDFYGDAGVAPAEAQFAQHTMASWFGFSGSPIFLPNGHVVLINNSSRTVSKGSLIATLAYGIRVDCLWELLAFHGLDSKVPIPMDKSALQLDRFDRRDAKEQNLRRASELIYESEALLGSEREKEAVDKCNQAIRLSRGYAKAYRLRGNAYTNYAGRRQDESRQDWRQYAEWGMADIRKYIQLAPSDFRVLIDYANALITSRRTREHPTVPEAEAILTKVLDTGTLKPLDRAVALCCRVKARNFEGEAAMSDADEAIRLDPHSSGQYFVRANCWEAVGQARRAAADMKRRDELRGAEIARARAHQFLQKGSTGDLEEAKSLLRKACEATEYECWEYVVELADVHFYSAEYDSAVKWLTRAYELAPDEEKGQLRRDIKAAQAKLRTNH